MIAGAFLAAIVGLGTGRVAYLRASLVRVKRGSDPIRTLEVSCDATRMDPLARWSAAPRAR